MFLYPSFWIESIQIEYLYLWDISSFYLQIENRINLQIKSEIFFLILYFYFRMKNYLYPKKATVGCLELFFLAILQLKNVYCLQALLNNFTVHIEWVLWKILTKEMSRQ